MNPPQRHLCTYVLDPQAESRLLPLLELHWRELSRIRLLRGPPACYRLEWGADQVAISEVIPYRDRSAAEASLRDERIQRIRLQIASVCRRRIQARSARPLLRQKSTQLVMTAT